MFVNMPSALLALPLQGRIAVLLALLLQGRIAVLLALPLPERGRPSLKLGPCQKPHAGLGNFLEKEDFFR